MEAAEAEGFDQCVYNLFESNINDEKPKIKI